VESGNVGIGTTNPQGGLVVTNGNVGIGTWTTVGGNLIVNGGGNVGISSAWPGTTLDVNGTVRATAMLIGANNVCQSTGTNCPAGGTNPWLVVQAAGNVGITTTRSVGIGTTSAGAGAGLLVMNGNVGIGTWAPAGIFQVNNSTSSPLTVTSSGNVGIGTTTPQGGLVIVNGNVGIGTWTTVGGTLIVQMGNVGIGTVNPGQMLDVNGAIRSTLTGISNFSGNVGINSTNPGTDLDINGGRARFLGIGTTVPGSILCLKTDGTIGYCTGIVSGYQCTTCN